MHGLSQAQGVIRNLLWKRLGKPLCARIVMFRCYTHTFFARHSSPGRSGSVLRLRFLEASDCWGDFGVVAGGGWCGLGAKAASTSQTESSTSSPP